MKLIKTKSIFILLRTIKNNLTREPHSCIT